MTAPAFSGGGLDRAAALRADPAAMARALATGAVLALWRGKPLVRDGGAELCWLAAGDAVLDAAPPPVFLGLDDGRARFAQDISAWTPPPDTAQVEAGFLDASVQRHPGLPGDAGFRELRALMPTLSPREAEIAATAKALTGWHAAHRFCAACGAASSPEKAGWQRRCPACGTTHFPRTDPVVIMLVRHGNRALMGRSPGWPPGMYSCLAGFVEPGETLETAVRREVAEETGVRVGAVRYIASQPWPFPASLMVGCVAEAVSETITLDPEELEDARWISREEMAAVMAGTHPAIRAPRGGAIAQVLMLQWLADRLD
jgi:NAD+ diphosphatase